VKVNDDAAVALHLAGWIETTRMLIRFRWLGKRKKKRIKMSKITSRATTINRVFIDHKIPFVSQKTDKLELVQMIANEDDSDHRIGVW